VVQLAGEDLARKWIGLRERVVRDEANSKVFQGCAGAKEKERAGSGGPTNIETDEDVEVKGGEVGR